MTVLATRPAAAGRLRAAWAAAHDPVPGVPRWARIAALAVPLVVLPSGLWRVAVFTLHLPIAEGVLMEGDVNGDLPGWFPMELYVVLLSVLSEAVAFTAVGLIARWGEVFPRWMPGLRGRRVPVSAAVVPAAAGAAFLTVLWTAAVGNFLLFQETMQGRPLPEGFPLNFDDWKGVIGVVSYVPLVAWGPLLAAVTYAYYRRRTRSGT
ncbi:hypothetical protein [Actinomadura sp. 7K534]|uniref:hypothetical protein n=1 Tax=Actinomadura sp. 7K534 TaxID=2530366 RepID=UPI001049CD1A|nr:hypothetical protein [Actinomadura sp. 7K534]TDB95097.1 hypothetical protein E1266_14500 [Actinomadura sp. 7K534]